jgi:hypothetical protein
MLEMAPHFVRGVIFMSVPIRSGSKIPIQPAATAP